MTLAYRLLVQRQGCLAALLALLLAASARLGLAQTVRTAVRPSATDARITTFDSDHTVYYNPTAVARHELLVFLPGTFGKTRGTTLFCTTAADLGYHVISLMYPDSISASVCRDDADAAAFSAFRQAIIEGGTSAHITISRANSIENRLLQLLRYLQATQPTEGWGQYVAKAVGRRAHPDSTRLVWPRLALAGQSQGGGHAAWLARQHLVARVLLFSSPKDWSRYHNQPAAWYSLAQTPAARYFAFVHEQDRQGCTYAQQLRIFETLYLGLPVSVDGQLPPYQHAHALTTNYPGTPVASQQAHATEVTDARTPRDVAGEPLFKPIWVYMLTAK